jgi:mono/diheme cytochrome c family protein
MRLITTLFVLALLAGGFALLYIYSGAYNVAATAPQGTFESWLYATVMQKSVKARARPIEAPPLEDPATIANGGRLYGQMCEMCHGGPGIKLSDLARGLRPQAADLVRAGQNWKPKELFWIVKNGITMTGMPAWGTTHGDEELWSVVAFVTRLPTMRYEDYWRLTRGEGEHPATSDSRPPSDTGPAAGLVKDIPALPNGAKAEAKPDADQAKPASGAEKPATADAAKQAEPGAKEPAEGAGRATAEAPEPLLRVQARPQPKPEVPERRSEPERRRRR